MSAELPLKLGEKRELQIDNLGANGEGAARYAGFTVFVPGALAGETVSAKVTLLKKRYAVAELITILKKSPERVKPLCPFYAACGGCQLQHLSYIAQLAFKQQRVADALKRIGHLRAEIKPTLGSGNPWHYRNKMQFPAAKSTDGQISIGCYANSSHKVVNSDSCLIQHEANNQVLQAVRCWLERYSISVYDEVSRRGLLRHVVARVGVATGEVMAALVTTAGKLPHQEDLLALLRQRVPGLVSVVQNINPRATNVILGKETLLLYGKPTLREKIGSLCFNISLESFFQVNSLQAEKLYETALAAAALTGKEIVLDLYCGTGTLSLYLAQKARRVYGIEIAETAIADARFNALANNCEKVEFICGDAALELPKLLAKGIFPDVAVLDPPRAGCDERVLASLAGAAPQRIVYVSCNPATLARDLAYLEQRGYLTQTLQPLDMFPLTSHVETVVLMSRAGT